MKSWRFRCVLSIAAFLAVTSTVSVLADTQAPPAPATPSATPDPSSNPVVVQLQSQVAALEQQILALQLQSAPLQYQAVQAQQQVATDQSQLAAAQLQLANANATLAQTTADLTSARADLDRDRKRLAALVIARYERTNDHSALKAVMNSKNLNQVLDTVLNYVQLTDDMNKLAQQAQATQNELTSLEAQQRDEQQQIVGQMSALQASQQQASTDQQRYQSQATRLTGQAAVLTQHLQVVLVQLAAAEGTQVAAIDASISGSATQAGALPPFAFGPRVDSFPWGQCTWYVASLRDVTWSGDAWQWVTGAMAAGKSVGMVPQPGAIVVFGPGNGYSAVGHVAYVRTVASPTSFVMDESNALGLGVVDQRLVGSLKDVEGFIYQ